MATDQHTQDQQDPHNAAPSQPAGQQQQHEDRKAQPDTTDALANKKPEDLTPEELRLMADTMPGEGPGD